MATQSDLTIGGIGADPSGSHPTGSLNTNWTEGVDDDGWTFYGSTIMAAQPATTESAEDYTAYSEVLCVGAGNKTLVLDIGTMSDDQVTACWQWYNPATSGVDADFAMTGNSGTFGNGTWTNIGTPARNYVTAHITPDITADALLVAKGTMLRVIMIVTDADDDGVASGLINASVATLNGVGTKCVIMDDREALYNLPMRALGSEDTAGSIGGIGADPS